ncbi:MAG TPA: DNA adenine methylase [Blastocatellia bacterium]|nr:DNA adenine methylase [Blastocatellia bacterium]
MRYPGGKNNGGAYQHIINLIPPHDVFIEGCMGSGPILEHKRPARLNIGIDLDEEVIARRAATPRPGFEFIRADIIEWLKARAWTGREFVYLDPPYLFETRSSKKPIYKYEFSDEQHVELLETILELPCKVMISGYQSLLYVKMLWGWSTYTFQSIKRNGQQATEFLWFNYPAPAELHDYSYLGQNFTQRQQFKRQRERWKERILRMDALKRQSILSALNELRAAGKI